MTPERIVGGACDPPFPVYARRLHDLLSANRLRRNRQKISITVREHPVPIENPFGSLEALR